MSRRKLEVNRYLPLRYLDIDECIRNQKGHSGIHQLLPSVGHLGTARRQHCGHLRKDIFISIRTRGAKQTARLPAGHQRFTSFTFHIATRNNASKITTDGTQEGPLVSY